MVGAGVTKRSTAALVFTLFPDKVLGEADVEVEFDTTEISLNRCSYKIIMQDRGNSKNTKAYTILTFPYRECKNTGNKT